MTCASANTLTSITCRVPVAAVTFSHNGQDVPMTRTVDGYWLVSGDGPYTFPAPVTITSIFGAAIQDTVPNGPVGTFLGGAQFPVDPRFATVGSGTESHHGCSTL